MKIEVEYLNKRSQKKTQIYQETSSGFIMEKLVNGVLVISAEYDNATKVIKENNNGKISCYFLEKDLETGKFVKRMIPDPKGEKIILQKKPQQVEHKEVAKILKGIEAVQKKIDLLEKERLKEID